MKTRRLSGFTLPELLVAISVATIVGAAVLSILLYSFQIWTNTVDKGRELAATDDFDLAFSRDFSSACPSFGCAGDASSCHFWTYRLERDHSERLVQVKYTIDEEGVSAETLPFPAAQGTVPLLRRFPTHAFRTFTYYGTNEASATGVPLWEDPSNAPSRVSLRLHLPPGQPRERFYRRRTP